MDMVLLQALITLGMLAFIFTVLAYGAFVPDRMNRRDLLKLRKKMKNGGA